MFDRRDEAAARILDQAISLTEGFGYGGNFIGLRFGRASCLRLDD